MSFQAPPPLNNNDNPITRWIKILTGQVQPTPEEARAMATGQSLLSQAGVNLDSSSLGARPTSQPGRPSPTQWMTGVGQMVGDALSGPLNTANEAGLQAERASRSVYGPSNGSFQETPYPTSQGAFSSAGGAPTSAAEDAYSAAYAQASGPDTYQGSASPAFSAQSTGPTGAAAGSSAQYPDESTRAANRQANSASAAAGGAATGGTGAGMFDDQIYGDYYQDPESFIDDQFAGKGVNTRYNRYARGWNEQWKGVMPYLVDFAILGQGGDPNDAGMVAQTMKTLGPALMSGQVTPAALVNQALARANEDPAVMQMLIDMGPDQVMGLRTAARGVSRRVANAQNAGTRERLAAERRQRVANPVADDQRNAIRIALG